MFPWSPASSSRVRAQAGARDRPRSGSSPPRWRRCPTRPVLGPSTPLPRRGRPAGDALGEALRHLSVARPGRTRSRPPWSRTGADPRRLEDDGFASSRSSPGASTSRPGVERPLRGRRPGAQAGPRRVGASWTPPPARRPALLRARGSRIAAPGPGARRLGRSAQVPRAAAADAPSTGGTAPRGAGTLESEIGQLAGLPGAAVCRTIGPDGGAPEPGEGRGPEPGDGPAPPAEIASGWSSRRRRNELTLRRALNALLDRILARPGGGGPRDRKVRSRRGSSRGLVASHRDAPRAERGSGVLRAVLGRSSQELTAPFSPRLELLVLAQTEGRQLTSSIPKATSSRPLQEGLRQVRASAGSAQSQPSSRSRRGRGYRAAFTARPARLNEPRAALVEEGFDGTPRLVNRQAVEVVREEWRVLDRWWTEEPVSRRYFESCSPADRTPSSSAMRSEAAGTRSVERDGGARDMDVHGLTPQEVDVASSPARSTSASRSCPRRTRRTSARSPSTCMRSGGSSRAGRDPRPPSTGRSSRRAQSERPALQIAPVGCVTGRDDPHS